MGLAVGLIGGLHRLLLGGVTCVPCSMATILAGLLAGMIFRLNKEKLIGIIPGMVFALAIEMLHAAVVLLIVSPFSYALEITVATIPQMAIAVSIGMGISIIIIHSTKDSNKPHDIAKQANPLNKTLARTLCKVYKTFTAKLYVNTVIQHYLKNYTYKRNPHNTTRRLW